MEIASHLRRQYHDWSSLFSSFLTVCSNTMYSIMAGINFVCQSIIKQHKQIKQDHGFYPIDEMLFSKFNSNGRSILSIPLW